MSAEEGERKDARFSRFSFHQRSTKSDQANTMVNYAERAGSQQDESTSSTSTSARITALQPPVPERYHDMALTAPEVAVPGSQSQTMGAIDEDVAMTAPEAAEKEAELCASLSSENLANVSLVPP